MNDPRAVEILEQAGAIVSNGHFVLPSGDHGNVYIERERIYDQSSASMDELCWRLAKHFIDREFNIGAVVGARKDGVVLIYAVARQLMALAGRRGNGVSVAFAEKAETKNLEFTGNYKEFVRDKRVLILQDIITTGATMRKLVRAVTACGGTVVAAATLCNRGGVEAGALGVPTLFSLTSVTLETYPESECPLCLRGEPVRQDVGKGREYLARKRSAAPQASI